MMISSPIRYTNQSGKSKMMTTIYTVLGWIFAIIVATILCVIYTIGWALVMVVGYVVHAVTDSN